MVPVDNTQAVGLRKVLTRRETNRVLKALKDGEVTTYDDWKGRFQANSEKMRTGDIRAVAEVMKSLTMLNEHKPLSYRERKMLDKARFLLVSELAEASDVSEQLESGALFPIASGQGHAGAVHIHQAGAVLWGGRLTAGTVIDVPLDRHVHLGTTGLEIVAIGNVGRGQ